MKKLLTILVVCTFLLPINSVFSKNTQYYDYVIITIDELKDSLSQFKNWKEFLGFSVKIVTTSEISSNYCGRDLQEKIRNFLIAKYQEWEIRYVLIVGSRSKIPMRDCAPDPFNHTDHHTDHLIPTDYYYADLTGIWDSDNDGYFGEYTEDNMDFYPEVYVGRIPSDSTDKVKEICQQIINFESNNGSWKKNALLLGPILFYEGYKNEWGTWHRSDGATLMERCWKNILQPNGFTATRMYEKDGLKPSIYSYDYPLNHSNVLGVWKNGYGIVNMVGHSNQYEIDRLIWLHDDGDNIPEDTELGFSTYLCSGDGRALGCKIPPIVFSAGCNQLSTSTNMGKSFIGNKAAVAFVGATGMSWYNVSRGWRNEGDGGCLSIDYYFFYYLINEKQSCGEALYNSKIYYYEHFGFPITRQDWADRVLRFYSNLYSFNLYGDPSLGLFTGKKDNEPPIIIINKPKGHLYIFDKEILPLPNNKSVIIGNITIEIAATDNLTGIKNVELYIDNELKETLNERPYKWRWDEKTIGRHIIKVIGYDNSGNTANDEVDIWIFNR